MDDLGIMGHRLLFAILANVSASNDLLAIGVIEGDLEHVVVAIVEADLANLGLSIELEALGGFLVSLAPLG